MPGIYRAATGTVWAPNIPGWDDYPLRQELEALVGEEVRVDRYDLVVVVEIRDPLGPARVCRDLRETRLERAFEVGLPPAREGASPGAPGTGPAHHA